MPKATVDEYDDSTTRQNYVGRSRQIALVQSEAQTVPMQNFANAYLRPRVGLTDTGHDGAAGLRSNVIGQLPSTLPQPPI